MTKVGLGTRVSASVLALLAMVMHSGGDTATLVAIAAGGSLLLLGIWAMSRTAAVGGFLITVGVASYLMDLGTLTDAQGVLFASTGLFVPALAIGWAALTSEEEEPYPLRLRTRETVLASLFAVACIVSVPAAMVLASLVAPSTASQPSTLLEIAIVLVVATAPVAYSFALAPERDRASPESADLGHEGA